MSRAQLPLKDLWWVEVPKPGGFSHPLLHARICGVAAKALFEHADSQALDATAQGLGVVVGLTDELARVDAVRTRQHFQQPAQPEAAGWLPHQSHEQSFASGRERY